MTNLRREINGYLRQHHVCSDDMIILSLFLPLSLLLTAELIMSLEWRMEHDFPLLHYVAFLIDHYNYIPYKDIFETSMPGTFVFHLGIGKCFGYGDLAFRIVDITWFLTLLVVTWAIVKHFGRRVAWATVVLFGLTYFQHGPEMSLQRDYVGILPISMAILLAISQFPSKLSIRTFLIGIFFCSITVAVYHR